MHIQCAVVGHQSCPLIGSLLNRRSFQYANLPICAGEPADEMAAKNVADVVLQELKLHKVTDGASSKTTLAPPQPTA